MSDAVIRQNQLAYSRIADEWERRQAADYDFGFHEQCRNLFLERLTGKRVLDFGCGLGLDTAAFAAAGLDVVAADIVREFLTITKRRTPGVSVVAADMTASCFGPKSFDGIFAVASFLHVPHHLTRTTLAAFAEALGPEGVLFLHHVASLHGHKGYQIDALLVDDNPAACFCHAERDLVSAIEEVGLRPVSLTHVKPSRHPSATAVRNGLVPYQLIAMKRQ